jgi:Heterokaryon incompatibility protein (HET)
VVLIETHGLRGQYCTLSHCWGPVDRQPISRTKDTVNAHLKGIALDSLPKTFQDAVVATRNIGLQYLWIDSLCILQDDEIEWAEESAKIGFIYEHARLTIAAANAADSSEGCFIGEKLKSRTMLIPYQAKHGDELKLNTIQVSNLYPPGTTLSESALGKRGWALQEWRLSRRIVFFTYEGALWQCKKRGLDCRDQKYDLQQHTGWMRILEDYSERQLTYKIDRLSALDGLANEMQKARNDRYCLGMWTKKFPENLFWARVAKTEGEDISELPSWTWASRGGKKVFLDRLTDWRREVTNMQVAIKQNVLQIKGSLRPCSLERDDDIEHNFYLT